MFKNFAVKAACAIAFLAASAGVSSQTPPPVPADPADYEFRVARIVRLNGELNRASAIAVIQRLNYLDQNNPDGKDITLVLNSSGGDIEQGLAIYDTMRNLKSDVRTVCEGRAMSMAAILLAGGTAGKRTSLPGCRIMLHQISSASGGRYTDMAIHHGELVKQNAYLMDLISRLTNRDRADVTRALVQDYYLDADEAKKFGVIDTIENSARPALPFGTRRI